MDPIAKKDPHPVIDFSETKTVEEDGDRFYRTVLSYEKPSGEEMTHNVDVILNENEEKPGFQRQVKALNTGIDKFHSQIRDELSEEEKEDPIREV